MPSEYTSVSVAPYRPPQYSSRAGSVPPVNVQVSTAGARSRSSWAPASGRTAYGGTTGGVGGVGGWAQTSTTATSTTRYQPRASSVPPLSIASRSSYSTSGGPGGAIYRRPTRPYDPDLDDEDVVSTVTRSRYTPTTYSPRSRSLTSAGHRAVLKQQSLSYLNDADEDVFSSSNLRDLRAKASQIREGFDKHKQLVDRYRVGSTSNGPSYSSASSVGGTSMSRDDVDRKYANIISNYRLDTTPTYTSSSTSNAGSYKPPVAPKREVSEARRKLRKVISESKGNKRYYD